MTATVHAASWVLTGDAPPQRDAAVLVEGDLVVEVGPRQAVLRSAPGARVREHQVLLPGLVNAHAHLEYGPPFADLATSGLPFPDWIAELTRRRRAMSPADWLAAARASAHELLRTGTTCVADVVTTGPGATAAARAGLRGWSFVEAVGADDARWPVERERVEALLAAAGPRAGISPHTLYTLGTEVFRQCADLARARGLRLHPHLAETAEEAEWVLAGTGRFRDAAARFGLAFELADVGSGLTPVELCDALGGLGPDVHVAHGVHVGAADRALLRERGTAVALCTRSNAVLQAGEAPVAAYLEEGSPVALGTDSLASSPDLDLLAEARATRALALRQGADPRGLAERLVRVMTVEGARAVGVEAGVLAPGRPADLAAFDVPDPSAVDDPHEALLAAGRCAATVLGGRLVHRSG